MTSPRRIVGLLLLYAALCHFNRISLSVAGSERLMSDFGISETLMGAVYSAYLLAYTLLMTPGGWFIDRFGARAALLVVGFGSALFVGLTGATGLLFASAATVVPALILVRALMGAANAPFHPGAATAISRWTPAPGRAWANGLVNGAAVLGIASTYFVFGFLMDRLGWPAAFLCAAAVTGLAASAWAVSASDGPAPVRLPPRAERPHRRRRSLLLLTFSYAAVGYFEYLFFYWMQYYFDKVLGLGRADGRLYATIPTIAMAAGMAFGGWLSDRAQARWGVRRGRAAVPVGGMIGSAVLLGAGIASRDPAWVVACFSLALASVGACEGAFWTTAVDLGGARGGTSAAIVNTGGNVGGLLAPIVTPLFSQYFGWKGGLGLACVFCLLGAVLWAWIDPEEGAQISPAPPSLGDGIAPRTVS